MKLRWLLFFDSTFMDWLGFTRNFSHISCLDFLALVCCSFWISFVFNKFDYFVSQSCWYHILLWLGTSYQKRICAQLALNDRLGNFFVYIGLFIWNNADRDWLFSAKTGWWLWRWHCCTDRSFLLRARFYDFSFTQFCCKSLWFQKINIRFFSLLQG